MRLAPLLVTLLCGVGQEAPPRTGLEEILRRLDQGQAASVEVELRGRLAKGQNTPAVRYLLGVALVYQRHFAEAEAEFLAAVEARPDRPQWFATLARCQIAMGQCSAATLSLGRAIALADRASYRFDRAGCAATLGRFAAAETDLKAVLAASPRHLGALLALADVLHDLGRSAEARGLLEGALPWAEESAELHYRLGRSRLAAGESAAAAVAFRAALARLPTHLGATYGLAQALAVLGQAEEARRERARFAELSRREEVIENRRQFLALEPANLPVILELAGLLLDLGRAGEALELLDGARRLVPPGRELSELLARAAAAAGSPPARVEP